MDWIGFGFENYDGWGRHRTTENGLPIDSSGTVYSDPAGPARNLSGLTGTNSLALVPGRERRRQAVHACATGPTSRTAPARWSQDACTYDAIYQEASSNSFSLKSTLMAIIHAKNFTQRVQDQ